MPRRIDGRNYSLFDVDKLFRLEELSLSLEGGAPLAWIAKLGKLPKLKRLDVEPIVSFSSSLTASEIDVYNTHRESGFDETYCVATTPRPSITPSGSREFRIAAATSADL